MTNEKLIVPKVCTGIDISLTEQGKLILTPYYANSEVFDKIPIDSFQIEGDDVERFKEVLVIALCDLEELNKGKNDNKQELNKQLIDAARTDNLDEIKESLKKGADVNAKNEDGNTALMMASHEGYEEIVKILLEKGADVNAKNKYGNTALMLARFWGREGVVKILEDYINKNK